MNIWDEGYSEPTKADMVHAVAAAAGGCCNTCVDKARQATRGT